MTPSRALGTETVAVNSDSALLTGPSADEVVTATPPAIGARSWEAVNGLCGQLWPFVWTPRQVGGFVGSLTISALAVPITRIVDGPSPATSQAAFRTADARQSSAGRERHWRSTLVGAAVLVAVARRYATSTGAQTSSNAPREF